MSTTTTDKPAPPSSSSSSTKDKPPAKPRGKSASSSSSSRGPGRPSNDDKLAQELAQKIALVFGAGAALSSRGPDAFTATGEAAKGSIARDLQIVAEQAEPLAQALVKVSKRNKPLRAAIETITATGDTSELVVVLLAGIVFPILANHDLLPPMLLAALGGGPELELVPDGPAPQL